jgi:hypothetical protein
MKVREDTERLVLGTAPADPGGCQLLYDHLNACMSEGFCPMCSGTVLPVDLSVRYETVDLSSFEPYECQKCLLIWLYSNRQRLLMTEMEPEWVALWHGSMVGAVLKVQRTEEE